MNSTIPEKTAPSSDKPSSKFDLSLPATLALLFVMNGIFALALVQIFLQCYGVSRDCIQTILIVTAVSLSVLAAHQMLTLIIQQNTDFGRSIRETEWESLEGIFIKHWRVIRDGISDSSDAGLSERFANSIGNACFFVGCVSCLVLAGSIFWPRFSPLTDLLGSMLILIVLLYVFGEPISVRRILSVWENSFGTVYRAVSNSPRIWLSLFLTCNFLTAAYGITPCFHFAKANDLPLVPTFFVLSVIPTMLYCLGFCLFLTSLLAVFCDAPSESTDA